MFFKERGIEEFKVVVGSTLNSAVRFYEKMGAAKIAEIEVHEGCRSWVLSQHIR
jgi:hypothetical protein